MTHNRSERGFEIHHAVGTVLGANALGSVYWISALLYFGPWRSIGLGTLGVVSAATFSDVHSNPMPIMLAVVLFCLLLGVELLHRRAYLTSDALVMEAGLFRIQRASYPVAEVRDVTARCEGLGRLVSVGDVEVLGYGWAVSLIAVKRPEDVAEAIRGASRTKKVDAAGGRTRG